MRTKLNIPSGEQQQKCFAIHAEENVIVQAAIHGISLVGCDIYCTTQPCILCARKIISIQPKNLYYLHGYHDVDAIRLFEEVAEYGIMLHKFNGNDVYHWGFK